LHAQLLHEPLQLGRPLFRLLRRLRDRSKRIDEYKAGRMVFHFFGDARQYAVEISIQKFSAIGEAIESLTSDIVKPNCCDSAASLAVSPSTVKNSARRPASPAKHDLRERCFPAMPAIRLNEIPAGSAQQVVRRVRP
jgi:hypothetical protein